MALNIPGPAQFPGVDREMPYAFIGDEAFALSPNILRPYSGTQLEERKSIQLPAFPGQKIYRMRIWDFIQ